MEIKHIYGKDVTDDLLKQLYDIENQSSYDPYDFECFKEIVTYDTNDTFYLVENNQVLGHATFNSLSKKYKDSVYCINLSVQSRYHSEGITKPLLIAKAIIYDAYKYYKNNDISFISGEVDKENIITLQMCLKLGFEIVQELSDDDQYFLVLKKEELIKLKDDITKIKL